MLTVYTVAYNEEVFIKFMIDHYKKMVPNCHVVVYDNYSTDKTVELAKAAGAEVRFFDTGGYFSDTANINIKNSAWKDAKTDWILCCDVDELLEITEDQLKEEEAQGTTLVRSEGWAMTNLKDSLDPADMIYGARSTPYDKPYLFNKKFIQEINYAHGCHHCKPKGKIVYSQKVYRAFHYKNINADYLAKRVQSYAARLSPENLKFGWGRHYLISAEQAREDFRVSRLDVQQLLPEPGSNQKIEYLTKNHTITAKQDGKVSVVITSYNRIDLLEQTIDSFRKLNKFPIEKFIVIEDSCNKEMHHRLTKKFKNTEIEFIFNETNLGQTRSIDKAYSQIDTQYIFHSEDDYLYSGNPLFIQDSIDILEECNDVHQVWLRHLDNYKISHGQDAEKNLFLPEVYHTKTNVPYRKLNVPQYGNWYGFSWNPGLRRTADYQLMFPKGYGDFLQDHEKGNMGEFRASEQSQKFGYRAAYLINGACATIGHHLSTYK